MKASHPRLKPPVTAQALRKLIAVAAHRCLNASSGYDSRPLVDKHLIAQRMLPIGVRIDDVLDRQLALASNLVQHFASVLWTVRSVHHNDAISPCNKPRGACAAEFRVAVLVDHIVRHPDEDVGLNFPDMIKCRSRGKHGADPLPEQQIE